MITVESVMSKEVKLTDVNEVYQVIISERFYNYLSEQELMKDNIQSSVDIAEAINSLYTSAVARPIIYPVIIDEDKTLYPDKSLFIEYNNKLINLSDRVYDVEVNKSTNASMIDEYLIPKVIMYPSERCYEIRDAIKYMLRMR